MEGKRWILRGEQGSSHKNFLDMLRNLDSIPKTMGNCWSFKSTQIFTLEKSFRLPLSMGWKEAWCLVGEPTFFISWLLGFILVWHLKCPGWKVERVHWMLRVRVWIATWLTQIAHPGEISESPCASTQPKSHFVLQHEDVGHLYLQCSWFLLSKSNEVFSLTLLRVFL